MEALQTNINPGDTVLCVNNIQWGWAYCSYRSVELNKAFLVYEKNGVPEAPRFHVCKLTDLLKANE